MNSNSAEWNVTLQTALANGQQRLVAMEKAAAKAEEERQAEIDQAWMAYNTILRAALPEVLRPMVNFMDAGLDRSPVVTEREYVLVNGEPWGFAPICVRLDLNGVDHFEVAGYEVYGVCIMHNAQGDPLVMFETGDECFEVEPVIEMDVELALARAERHYQRMLDIRFGLALNAREEVEYLPVVESVECAPGGLLAEKCLASAIRAIVVDEMYKPPSAA